MASGLVLRTTIPVTAAVSNPCPIRSTLRPAHFVHTAKKEKQVLPMFSPAKQQQLLTTKQQQQQEQQKRGMEYDSAGCWSIPQLWFPPQSRLSEFEKSNRDQPIQAIDLMSLKEKERVIFPTCLYGSCERDVESELIRDLKAACWEQGAFELSTQERTGQTARRSLTLRLRMRCANHTAKRGSCPFQFTVFWNVVKKHWYYTPPPQADLKLRHVPTCLPLGVRMVVVPPTLATQEPSLMSPPPVVVLQSKPRIKRSVIKKGSIPTLRKAPCKKLLPTSCSDRFTLDSCLEKSSQLPTTLNKKLAPSSPSDRITLESCLAASLPHVPISKELSLTSSLKSLITLEACLAASAHQQQARPSAPHKKQVAPSSTQCKKFPPPSSHKDLFIALPKSKVSSSSSEDPLPLAAVCKNAKQSPMKRIFSDDLSLFFQQERQASNGEKEDSSASRTASIMMEEAAQTIFADFLQDDIISVSAPSECSLSRQSSISSWGVEEQDFVPMAQQDFVPMTQQTPLLWDDLDFAAPQA